MTENPGKPHKAFVFEESINTSDHRYHTELYAFVMTRSALFVIDIQRELADDPKTQIPHADRIRSSGEKILSAARNIVDQYRAAQTQSPSVIVFVQHEENPDQGTLVRDTEPWSLVFEPRGGVQEERLVAKTTRKQARSAARNDALNRQLNKELTHGRKHIRVEPRPG